MQDDHRLNGLQTRLLVGSSVRVSFYGNQNHGTFSHLCFFTWVTFLLAVAAHQLVTSYEPLTDSLGLGFPHPISNATLVIKAAVGMDGLTENRTEKSEAIPLTKYPKCHRNKAGYTATQVACRRAGAIFEITRPFGQEQ